MLLIESENFIIPRRSTPSCAKAGRYSTGEGGFTLLELLVTSFLGLLLLALSLAATMSNKRLYAYDLARTKINQNLRSALEIMGADLREAGENLPSSFPAIEIVNGTSGAADQIIVRRNLLDEVFPFCASITAGSSTGFVTVADNGVAQAGCAVSQQAHNYSTWGTYRSDEGGTVPVYAFNSGARVGEFFNFIGESAPGTQYRINRSSGTWTNAYPAGTSSLYVLEEWRFSLVNGVLQVIENQDPTNPLNIVDQIADFQVSALMQDGTTLSSFAVTDDWTNIQTIQVVLTGQDTALGQVVSKTVAAQFAPRNILSN